VHELNAAAASVWRRADGATPIAALMTNVSADTGLPADEEIVHLALAQLAQAGLLEGPHTTFDAKVSRRRICQRLGLTGSVAMLLPIVSSIVAPTPAMAQSRSPTIAPTMSPTGVPTAAPTASPTATPGSPTAAPTSSPTASPTGSPTASPTGSPTASPTGSPTVSPTSSPTRSPTPPLPTDDSAAPTDDAFEV
jgi:hypothetical protein